MSTPKRFTSVHFRQLTGPLSLEVRPLSYEELGEIAVLARETGWYGNSDLLSAVLKYGVDGDEQIIAIVEGDIFMMANVAREIWLITLKAFRQDILKLVSLVESSRSVPRVRRYLYSDLATPALLAFVWQDMQEIEDLGSIVDFFLESHIADIRFGDEPVGPEGREAFLKKHEERVVPWVLELLGFDKNVMNRRPLSLFTELPERLFVVMKLVTTLDWMQFGRLLRSYNEVLDELVYLSRRLGGSDISRERSKLMTGMVNYLNLIAPPESVPQNVLLAVADDIAGRKRGKAGKAPLSAHDLRLVSGFMSQARQSHHSTISEVRSQDDMGHAMILVLNDLGKMIDRDKRLVARLCHVYRGAYLVHLKEIQKRALRRFKLEAQNSILPQGFLLVEGPSDKIYFEGCLRSLMRDVALRVEDCGGKSGVVTRFREMTRRHYLGSIFAVLDGDAEQELKDLDRIGKNLRYAGVVKFDHGEIEDQIPVAVHVEALNSAFPEGMEIRSEDIKPGGSMARSLARELWNKRGVQLDKVAHAKAVVEIFERDDIVYPSTLTEILEKALAVTDRRAREVPSIESVVSFDRINRRMAQLLERLD